MREWKEVDLVARNKVVLKARFTGGYESGGTFLTYSLMTLVLLQIGANYRVLYHTT